MGAGPTEPGAKSGTAVGLVQLERQGQGVESGDACPATNHC